MSTSPSPQESPTVMKAETDEPTKYPSTILLASDKEDYVCVVCTSIAHNPYSTTNCECTAVYCKQCIKEWLSTKSTCPNCRTATAIHDCSANKWLQKKINQLDVKCVHNEAGCNFNGTYGKLA